MGQALYRAHRPKKLSDVVGQEHVTTALARALEKGTIAHAYLFTGPRGTGKTSIARILAHEINNLPYEDDSSHLDIIEIDAASNRRIDEIRELRDKVHIAPTSVKYKVYIIDEVHMLTKEAFNALLKTLEEPPAHVVFILATTEAHKLPETIISRTQRFSFKPVDLAKVTEHLRHIADAEGIQIDDDALALIAAHGEGSFRDSISLLDQVRNTGEKVTLADVQAVLGIAPKDMVESLIAAVAAHDAPHVVQLLNEAHAAGHEPARMAKQLGETLRAQLLDGNAPLPNDQLLELLAKLIEVPASGNPRGNLEVALLDIALAGAPAKKEKTAPMPVEAKPAVQVDPHPALARKRAAESRGQNAARATKPDSNQQNKTASEQNSKPEPSPETEHDETQDAPVSDDVIDPAMWPQILTAIKQHHNTLYGIVKAVRPHFEPGKIILECGYTFHQKRLSEKANQDKLAKIIQATTGKTVRVVSIIGEPLRPDEVVQTPPSLPPADEIVHTVAPTAEQTTEPAKTSKPADLETISNIFGGAEVLES
ncbi:DNA polymerase III subunit gamma/tau [Candidatus Saccharibacteria bacterium]|nr:DNA polymerase III subunit gamma/tau [Candidatus Saccharibacteria bacterium]